MDIDRSRLERGLFTGFIRLHVLHHCHDRPWFGQELMAELSRHGYRLSFGTLYPLLHDLEASGWLARDERLVAGKWRKYYRTTASGSAVLATARRRVAELSAELQEATHEQ